MKIGVFTLPLNTNYGGILQAYALQTVLKRLGHTPVLLERKVCLPPPQGLKAKAVALMVKILFGKESLKRVVWEQVDAFVRDNMVFRQEDDLESYLNMEAFDAYVVGSDQVWRPIWGNYMPDYFLDFAKEDDTIIKVAYAASFAVNDWEFTPEETKQYAPLARLFDAVSVREQSGIALCKEYLGIDAVQMADPTLLLDKSDYEKLVLSRNEQPNKGNLFCYILDQSAEKQQMIDAVAERLSLVPFQLTTRTSSRLIQLLLCRKRYQTPAVTKWLRGFMDAECVVTDSFHGCVFSIIFNKPFWAIGNAGRGMARFTSLLKMFGLEDRMLLEQVNKDEVDFAKPIDWSVINKIKEEWKQKAFNFLSGNLNVKI